MRVDRISGHPRRGLDAAVDAAYDATVVGGVLAMPVGGLAAIVGPVLPAGGPFHQFEGLVYGIAVLWFAAALLGAHLRQTPHRSQPGVPATDRSPSRHADRDDSVV